MLQMKWSIKLGNVAGIGIHIHWTFLLLVGWILVTHLADGDSVRGALTAVAFLLALFFCIVLHELGHAFMARHFGVRTRDITLLPIGGVARLEHIPEEPIQEFLIAIAGPLVNVVIAIVLIIVVGMTEPKLDPAEIATTGGSFLVRLLLVNVGLVVFNIIPAFPMDGGRMLRAILAIWLGHLHATDVAASIGQLIAILFGVVGFFGNGMLIFIALFIYMGAQQEAQLAQVRALLHGVPVRSAMMTVFRVLSSTDSLETAVKQYLAGDQKDFPVVDDGRLVGIVRGNVLMNSSGTDQVIHVADIMQSDCRPVEDSAMLQGVLEQMQVDGCSSLPVVRKGQLIGMVSLENIGAWLMHHANKG
jgi:Zn-dependent protease/predicted transcriptional regulator